MSLLRWLCLLVACKTGCAVAAEPPFRPPAVPLVTFDPFLSVWSKANRLTDDATRHWTGREQSLVSLIRIDGKAYRLMGSEPANLPAFPQVGVRVFPTRSIYEFDDARLHVTLTFMTAALPSELEVLARPLSYLTWEVRSADGAPHTVALYDSTSSQLAVNRPDEKVEWSRERAGPLTALRVGVADQNILGNSGDDQRIDWGYAYAAAPADQSSAAIGAGSTLAAAFISSGRLPLGDDARTPRAVGDAQPVMAFAFDLGRLNAAPVARHLLVAYDEIYAIGYFGQKLRPYWRRNGATPADLLAAAERDYHRLVQRCAEFDADLMAALTRSGGARYAQLAALAYRQCLAANGLAADAQGAPLLFTKENTSNGDIATVDVIFPQDPIFLFLSPTLAKASLVPILSYAASPRWRYRSAPHDLGYYPMARGIDSGGEAMPVEESGNMLILCDAVAQAEGNADFAGRWWPQLTQWAGFLEDYGLDPENQLCTDDFMGRLAHNANLSVKAIVALGAYGDLCRRRGDLAGAEKYARLAKADARHWMQVDDDGDHYRIAFDRPGTWSQKYNLIWDRLLGLDVFPDAVAQKEIAYYKTKLRRYGLPLDSRTDKTKSYWTLWSAALAERREDFEDFVGPLYDYFTTTAAREPLADSYRTEDLATGGMHARPVVGGLFIKMLDDSATWKDWASRDKQRVADWAPLPPRLRMVAIGPASPAEPQVWRAAGQPPDADWNRVGFDDRSWPAVRGPFGGVPGSRHPANWIAGDLWLRRELTLSAGEIARLQFYCYHRGDVEIYLNGVRAAREGGKVPDYDLIELEAAARASLRPDTRVILAVHCHRPAGRSGAFDLGLVEVEPAP